MTGAAEAEAVRRVLQYRQQARLGVWVTYWRGPPLDRLHPVAALVKGWAKQGLVELGEESGPRLQRPCLAFRRLEADFPAWWHSKSTPLAQPPARRDPEAVGIAWMAHEAGQADERAEWLHYAAAHYRAKLYELAAAAGAGELPAEAAEWLTEAGLVLLTFEQMLNPEAPTPKRLVVGKRPITAREKERAVAMGKKPPRARMTHSAALKEHAAALEVEKAVAAGVKRASAVNKASKGHGLSEGALNARLANRAAWRRLPSDRQLREAAGLARSLQAGGILQGNALALAAEVFGQPPAAIRKAMKEG